MKPDRLNTYTLLIQTTYKYIQTIDETKASHKTDNTVWSAKEIMGHLIDSAFHNHLRFMHACEKDDLIFEGYPQRELVDRQQFQKQPWQELINAWFAINQQMLRSIAYIPDELLIAPRKKHSLDKIAMRKLASDQPATLLYLIEDYFAHIEVHLKQLKERVA